MVPATVAGGSGKLPVGLQKRAPGAKLLNSRTAVDGARIAMAAQANGCVSLVTSSVQRRHGEAKYFFTSGTKSEVGASAIVLTLYEPGSGVLMAYAPSAYKVRWLAADGSTVDIARTARGWVTEVGPRLKIESNPSPFASQGRLIAVGRSGVQLGTLTVAAVSVHPMVTGCIPSIGTTTSSALGGQS